MIIPRLSGDLFLADVQQAVAENQGIDLWWLGQSGFLVRGGEQFLLFDPYLSDSLTEKYAHTDKPHVRISRPVIAPSRLDMVNVVTSSHNHTDHLDAATLIPLMQANSDLAVVVSAANQQFAAERLGVDSARLTPAIVGEPLRLGNFCLHVVPAAHEQIELDLEGRHRFVGYVVEVEGRTIYHSGDTMQFEGMVETLRPWGVDLALVPINGRRPERRVAGNLWGREAAALAKAIGAGTVVPCHYDMFAFNTETPDEFIREAEAIGQPFRVLKLGERFSLASG